MSTPHNQASPGDFAKTCLMPGDPLRSRFIAENFLENPVLVNDVRGVQGYTGTYRGVRVSVMASGMGMPSIAIYSHELYSEYGVENILRIGSAGSISKKLRLRDVAAGIGSCTDSNFMSQYGLPGTYAPTCSFALLQAAVSAADALGISMPVGNFLSSDAFYSASGRTMEWAKMGVLAVEMESAALYATAAYLGRRALALCSISDDLLTGEALSAEERRVSFGNMIKIALETAVAMQNSEVSF